jgi:SAM-dependent methyltransferase
MQAAHYAIRWPNARVTGIDVSETSLAFERSLKSKHGLENLHLRRLEIEDVGALGQSFDHIVCTGVLHHLADPDAGLRALRSALEPDGSLHCMVYAPYGRAGIYMVQEYCRQIGMGRSERDVDELATALRALPPDHPIAALLRTSPDFAERAGLADALLHPRDRAYSVAQLFAFLHDAGLEFGRWVRQAPYLPECGAIASSPHRSRLEALPPVDRFGAIELFRGTMSRHSAIAYRNDRNVPHSIDFASDAWPSYVPVRLPNTVVVRERLPAGAAAVLINRSHTFTDLFLPLDQRELRLFNAIDERRSIDAIANGIADRDFRRSFFEKLWNWDQVVFDASGSS